jgi:hypothetical protein
MGTGESSRNGKKEAAKNVSNQTTELSILTGQPHAHTYISYACLTYSVEFSTTLNGV